MDDPPLTALEASKIKQEPEDTATDASPYSMGAIIEVKLEPIESDPPDLEDDFTMLECDIIKREPDEITTNDPLVATSTTEEDPAAIQHDDVFSNAAIKQEVDIEPTVLQQPDIYFMPLPCKSEPIDDSLRKWKRAELKLKKRIVTCNLSSDNQKEENPTSSLKIRTPDEYHINRQRHKEKNDTPTQRKHSNEQRIRQAANSKAYRDRKKRLKEEAGLMLTKKLTQTHDERKIRNAAKSKAYRERKKLRKESALMQKCTTQESSALQSQREHSCEAAALIHGAETSGPGEINRIGQWTKWTWTKMDESVSSIEQQRLNQQESNRRKGNVTLSLVNDTPTNSEEKLHRCKVCKRCVPLETGQKTPVSIHSAEITYCCESCKKSRMHNLETHPLMQSEEKPYCCEICKKCFSQKFHLKTHVLVHSAEKPYCCEICKKSFSQKSNLNTHLLTHSGEKPYCCEICKKCFSQKSCLNRHELTHFGEKPYCCEICKMCFSQVSHLRRHELIHSGEKPYSCEICTKRFLRKSYLKTHVLTHSREKPHCCEICKKCFSQKSKLKEHVLTHSEGKPYCCVICKKCFSLMSQLRRHSFTHSAEKPYCCEICKKCFFQMSQLKRHVLTHSG